VLPEVAADECNAQGGHLASIQSTEDVDLIEALLIAK